MGRKEIVVRKVSSSPIETIMNLVSVIVPVYNAEKWLPRCIESILHQTYEDFEIILVNDGSKDNSLQVCQQYQQKDKRIKVLSQPNQGVTAARKAGLSYSRGKWIVFADADDYLENSSITILVDAAVANQCDLVKGSFVGTGSGRLWVHKKLGVMNHSEYLHSYAEFKTYGVVYASIYSKHLFQDSTFSFGRDIKIGEDVLMNIDIALRTEKAVNIDNIIYNYFDNEESVMRTKLKHPSYIHRFYDLFLGLLGRSLPVESLITSINHIENIELLNAFFSPYIEYTETDFRFIKSRILIQSNILTRLFKLSSKAVAGILFNKNVDILK